MRRSKYGQKHNLIPEQKVLASRIEGRIYRQQRKISEIRPATVQFKIKIYTFLSLIRIPKIVHSLLTIYLIHLTVVEFRGRSVDGGVFENRLLRRIFGPNRDEVTGEWRKLLNEELNAL